MNIAIRTEDRLFSQFIRLRDRECVACHSRVQFNEKGLPVSHQASHFWSRSNWGTRHDVENVDTLCFRDHQRWGGDYRGEYQNFKWKQLGERRYNLLMIRAHTYTKRDRPLALLYVKKLLEEQKKEICH